MKIVQAFGQEAREAARFAGAVERDLRRRQAPHRAARGDDRDRHRADLRLDHPGAVGRRDRRRRRADQRRIDRRLRADRRPRRRRVRRADRGLWRSAARRGRRRAASPNCSPKRPRSPPPANPVAAARSRRTARSTFDHVTFRYPTRPEMPALHDFSLDDRAGRDGRGGRPVGRGQDRRCSSSSSASTIPSAGACRIDGVDAARRRSRRDPRAASRWCRRKR